MSQGTLDKLRFETIEAYVLGTMPAEERVRFEQEMMDDDAWRAEVELQRENTLAIELGGVVRMMKSIAAEDVARNNDTAKTNRTQYLKYAAVVAIVLSGALWFLRPSANERLFAEHFTADPGLPVAMSATDNYAFADGMVSYKEGHFAKARAKWAPLLQQEPMNDTLRYYIASAWLADDNVPAAIPMLETLANEPASGFHARANWFLLLAYVHTGEIAKAQAIPLEGDTAYGERVRLIKAQFRN